MYIVHPFAPVFDKNSRILILGSFPSVKSRAAGFYYGHPQNRFWRVTAAVFGCETPSSTEEKVRFLLSNGIALWDAAARCEITGSSDSAITAVKPNDIRAVTGSCDIKKIFANGKTAEKLYVKFIEPAVMKKAVYLPSTSSANVGWSEEKLIEAWRAIKL